jgi:recombinational DNA repair protein RecR
MMKITKILLLFFTMAICFGLSSKVSAFDLFSHCTKIQNANGTFTQVCGPCKDYPAAPMCQQASSQDKTNPAIEIIRKAADIIAIVTGVVAVLMIMFGGLTLITSGGNTQNVEAARRRIIYALVGIVVIALAWTIIRFITDQFIQ